MDFNTFPIGNSNFVRDTSADSTYQKIVQGAYGGPSVQFSNVVGSGSVHELRPTLSIFPSVNRFITVRKGFNLAFAFVEVLWILNGRSDVEMLVHYNKNIATYSDDGVKFNAPYGYRIFERFGNQFYTAYQKLEANPFTRQAVIEIWDPVADNEPDHKDYACNLLSMMTVRGGELQWTQIMRSNDLVWGTPYNYVQFNSLAQIMASLIKVPVGDYSHFCNSSHIYDTKMSEAREIMSAKPIYYESPPLKCSSWDEFQKTLSDVSALELASRHDGGGVKPTVLMRITDPGWRNLLGTILIYNALKAGALENASAMLEYVTPLSYERHYSNEKIVQKQARLESDVK